jgi:hypothetical protein
MRMRRPSNLLIGEIGFRELRDRLRKRRRATVRALPSPQPRRRETTVPSLSDTIKTTNTAEHESFDAAAIAGIAYYLELAECERLAEEADHQADFYRHSGHDPNDTRLRVYDEASQAIATVLPAGYAVPTPEQLDEDWHLHRPLARTALHNICSTYGDAISAVVATSGKIATTIEAAVDPEFRSGLLDDDTPIHVFQTRPDGGRTELLLLVPENCEHYKQIAWLLDTGAAVLDEALAAAEEGQG